MRPDYNPEYSADLAKACLMKTWPKDKMTDFIEPGHYGYGPLHHESEKGRVETLRVLLQAGGIKVNQAMDIKKRLFILRQNKDMIE